MSIALGRDGITATISTRTVDSCWVAGIAAAAVVPTDFRAFDNYDQQDNTRSPTHELVNGAPKALIQQCKLPTLNIGASKASDTSAAISIAS